MNGFGSARGLTVMKRTMGLLFLLAWSSLLLTCAQANQGSEDLPPDLTQLNIEELMAIEIPTVVAASTYAQKITQAPSYVTIVTYEQIQKLGYRTLADILRSVNGFFVTYDRNYSYLGIRGFCRSGDYNTRFLILIDGHRLNDNIYDSLLLGTEFPLDIDLIERVEIIRGPSSSLYGDTAFSGIIHVITRRGREVDALEVSGSGGSLETFTGRLTYGNQFQKGPEVLLSGSLLDSEGNDRLYIGAFDHPSTNHGIAEDCDYDRSYSLFSTLSWHGLTLQASYGDRKKGIPTGAYETDFNDPSNWTRDRRGYVDLKYERALPGRWELLARAYYDYYRYDGNYIYGGAPNRDYVLGEWWGTELRATKTLWDKHKLVLGAEYIDDFKQIQKNYDEDPYWVYTDDRRSEERCALYLQGDIALRSNLSLNAGLRYDYYTTFGSTWNPRLALLWNPFAQTTLKLVYGSAFRAPNAYELYYEYPESQKANPDLDPEKIQTYECIWEQGLGKYLRATASLFYYKIDDLISQSVDSSDGLLVYQNLDSIETRGVELELTGRGPHGLEGSLGYSFHEAKDTGTGKDLTNSPHHLVKLSLIAPLVKEKWFLGVEEQFTSQRKTLRGNKTDAFAITNVTLLSRELLQGLEISGSIYNLFDEQYGDAGGEEHVQDIIRQDGRTFRVKFTWRF